MAPLLVQNLPSDSQTNTPKWHFPSWLQCGTSALCGISSGWLSPFPVSVLISSKLIESIEQHSFPLGVTRQCCWLWSWQPESIKHRVTGAQCKDSVNHDGVISFNRASLFLCLSLSDSSSILSSCATVSFSSFVRPTVNLAQPPCSSKQTVLFQALTSFSLIPTSSAYLKCKTRGCSCCWEPQRRVGNSNWFA